MQSFYRILYLMNRLFLLFFTFAFLFSCDNENDASRVVILCNPTSGQTTESGKKLLYEIETYSIESNLSSFQITSFDVENGEKQLLDTALNVQKFNYSFIYNVPEFSDDSISVALKLIATDLKNNRREFTCSVIATRNTFLLQELTGIVLYSGASGRPDAFSLNDPSQTFLKSLADSADIDVFDYTGVMEMNPETLSREWHTNTDIRFAKVNSLNYALATAQSLKNMYPSLIRQRYIHDIQANDIILLGRGDQVAGVMQIVNIADAEGSQNDYYLFNFKQLSSNTEAP
jgi:hypothetical protein